MERSDHFTYKLGNKSAIDRARLPQISLKLSNNHFAGTPKHRQSNRGFLRLMPLSAFGSSINLTIKHRKSIQPRDIKVSDFHINNAATEEIVEETKSFPVEVSIQAKVALKFSVSHQNVLFFYIYIYIRLIATSLLFICLSLMYSLIFGVKPGSD